MFFKFSRISLFILLLLLGQLSYAGLDQFDTSNSVIDIQEFKSGGPSKDEIPSLDAPQFVSVREVDFLRDEDKVVGIIINGEAKAYPIRILNWHEVVNDQVSGQKVVVTWCPLTHSAIAFDREINGNTLEFGVSGLLYNSNVVMYDRLSNGLWSQLKMEGLTGKFAGNHLDIVPSQVSSWRNWRDRYPQTLVLSNKTGHGRDYSRDPYADYHTSKQTMFPAGILDERLQPKSLVVGIKIEDIPKAYSLEKIARSREPYFDQVGDSTIMIQALNGGAVEVSDKNGNSVPSVVAYWFAWSAFNKDTLIYE